MWQISNTVCRTFVVKFHLNSLPRLGDKNRSSVKGITFFFLFFFEVFFSFLANVFFNNHFAVHKCTIRALQESRKYTYTMYKSTMSNKLRVLSEVP